MLDPARWPDRLQGLTLLVLTLGTGVIWIAGSPSSIGQILTLWLVLEPAVVGALVWRFDDVPWRVILSWTVPMTAWIAASLLLVDAPIRWLVAYTPASLWLGTFICWAPPARWWYRKAMGGLTPGG